MQQIHHYAAKLIATELEGDHYPAPVHVKVTSSSREKAVRWLKSRYPKLTIIKLEVIQ